jgi:hypothetical protein
VRVVVDIDDDLADEVAQRAGPRTWTQIITDCLVFALVQADTEQLVDERIETDTSFLRDNQR